LRRARPQGNVPRRDAIQMQRRINERVQGLTDEWLTAQLWKNGNAMTRLNIVSITQMRVRAGAMMNRS
jgi:hypothetical protein